MMILVQQSIVHAHYVLLNWQSSHSVVVSFHSITNVGESKVKGQSQSKELAIVAKHKACMQGSFW